MKRHTIECLFVGSLLLCLSPMSTAQPPGYTNLTVISVAVDQIRVNVQHSGTSTDDAQWQLDNGAWTHLSASDITSIQGAGGLLLTVGPLAYGTHTFSFQGGHYTADGGGIGSAHFNRNAAREQQEAQSAVTKGGAKSGGAGVIPLSGGGGGGGGFWEWSDVVSTSFSHTSGYLVNYIKSRTLLYPLQTTLANAETDIGNLPDVKKNESVAYANGLGKTNQSIVIKSTPTDATYPEGKDAVTTIEFDAYGLQPKSYAPYTSPNNNGSFRYSASTEQSQYYSAPPGGVTGTPKPYAQSVFEQSPLLRVTEQGAIGSDWQPGGGHTVRTTFGTNVTNEVRIFEISSTDGSLQWNSLYYSPNTLWKTTLTDENGIVTKMFKDKSDKEIMKQSSVGGLTVQTYYVYDNLGNLRFVIPPQGINDLDGGSTISQMKSKWVTEYLYDGYNHQVEKLQAEAQPVYTVYDMLGRVVLTQDGNMRSHQDWIFTKYDKSSRTIMTGVYHDPTTPTPLDRQGMQNYISGLSGFWESRVPGDIGYTTNQVFPIDPLNIWTITYYDDYDFDSDGITDPGWAFVQDFPSTSGTDAQYPNYWISGFTPFSRINDKITKSRTRQLEESIATGIFGSGSFNSCPTTPKLYYVGSPVTLLPGFQTHSGQEVHIGATVSPYKWIEAVNYYDTLGRLIQTQTKNNIAGTDISSTQYEYSGKVLRTKLVHMRNAAPPYTQITVTQRLKYDNTDHLIETYQQNQNGAYPADPEILVSKLTYNELGQVMTKKLHSTNGGSTFLQTVDNAYNERGWVTSVNNPYNLGTDLFGYKLAYNVLEAGMGTLVPSGTLPKYDGNISEMVWASQSNGIQGYAFDYDELLRLKGAWHGTYTAGWTASSDSKYNETNLTYDLNGNIKSVIRTSSTGVTIDNLTYGYDQLMGNRLDKVEDAAVASSGIDFSNGVTLGSGEYLYDANGNMTQDKNKGITIVYNYLNLPTRITWNDNRKIELLYSAAGAKLQAKTYDGAGSITETRDYVGGFEYLENTTPTLQQFSMSEGRIVNGGVVGTFDYEYYIKDQLGNVRLTFKSVAGSASRMQEDLYYPFGLRQSLYVSGSGTKYLFNSKEFVDKYNLSWYDYGARYYDPQLCRWTVMDPSSEFHTPYAYVGNNPVGKMDQNGSFSVRVVDGRIYVDYLSKGAARFFGLFPQSYAHALTGDNIFDRGDVIKEAGKSYLYDKIADGLGVGTPFTVVDQFLTMAENDKSVGGRQAVDEMFFTSQDILNVQGAKGTSLFVDQSWTQMDFSLTPGLGGKVGEYYLQVNPDVASKIYAILGPNASDEAVASQVTLMILNLERPIQRDVNIQQFQFDEFLYENGYSDIDPAAGLH